MPVLIRIAFRNLLEHKAKSLIIGILLGLGVIILVVGNAFMDTAAKGVKDTFIANYTGDVFVSATSKDAVSLFGSMSMGSGGDEVKVLPEYDRIMEHIRSMPGVTGAAGQVTGYGMAALKGYEDVDKSDSAEMAMLVLFGVDPASYNALFPSVKPVMGRLLEPGEQGLVISKKTFVKIKKKAGVEPKLGDQIVITGMGKAGFKIRSAPLVGVFGAEDDDEGKSYISYADMNTVRLLSGLTIGNDEDTPVTEEQKGLLAASEDELFGSETVVQAAKATAPKAAESAKTAEPRKAARADDGAWYFAVARLKSASAAPATIASLNAWFAKEGIGAKAGDWKAASNPFGSSVDVIRIVFNIAIIIVAIVAVIIMMNTLVISVIERTGEIGTMRALGAQKGYVRRMFLVETLTIALVFGLIGSGLAVGAIGILNALHIQASNAFLKLLFAGPVLHTSASLASIAWSLVLVGLVAVVAHLYPVSLALKIEPVRAMQSE
jgi:putative ABC transport system permease protein